jgi:hypothetical protein
MIVHHPDAKYYAVRGVAGAADTEPAAVTTGAASS